MPPEPLSPAELIAQIARMRRRLVRFRRLSYTDPLTRLANRRAWQKAWRALADSNLQGDTTLLLADLDGFKTVNHTFGHAAGDRVLRRAGRILRDQAGPSGDLAARLGGDEFALLLHVPAAGALAAAEKIRAALEAGLLLGEVSNTASIGGCMALGGSLANYGDLFEAADRGLRAAKRAGGNRVQFLPLDEPP